jgi:glycosyltransferase involved in cell wall biosynthesis
MEDPVKTTVTVDLAGGQIGGAARFRAEVRKYLEGSARDDIKVIGARRNLNPGWLAVREAAAARKSRRVALNNVGFLTPGGERWTLLRNPLHFLTPAEMTALDKEMRSLANRQIAIVHRAARRSDVLVAPCTAMAERVKAVLPEVADRVVVRMHPVSANPVPRRPGGSLILCPVLFAPYKHMTDRITDWVTAVGQELDESVRLLVTASPAEVPTSLAASPRLHFVGRLDHEELCRLWARSQAVYFPSGLEAFGWPLAEARVNGQPVIARDTPQNREIAGSALCGYTVSDPDSLLHATQKALAGDITPAPAPFDPDAYFEWLLGA